jgi:hypothetical protein
LNSGIRTAAAIAALLLTVACSTNRVNLKYESGAQHPSISTKSGISVGQFTDARGEPSHWIGAIRGGFGNPIKVIETDAPVSTVVANVFAAGLLERKALAKAGESGYEIRGSVKRFDCDQYARREATVELEITVKRLGDGSIVFYGSKNANIVSGSAITLSAGIFGSIEELRKVAEQTLREVVDKTLDDPELMRAVEQ